MNAVEHRIYLTQATRYGSDGLSKGHGKAHMTYQGVSLGEPSDEPLFDAARRLLNRGLARPDDTIVTYRGDMPCMRGVVGKAAELAVVETAGRQETETTPYVAPVLGLKFRPIDMALVREAFRSNNTAIYFRRRRDTVRGASLPEPSAP